MAYLCDRNLKLLLTMSITTTFIQAQALGEFVQSIAKEAYEQAYADIMDRMAKQAPRMYTRKEVAERLNVSLPTVHELVKQGIIVPTYVGRKPLFKAKDIEEAISTGELRKYKRRGTTQD